MRRSSGNGGHKKKGRRKRNTCISRGKWKAFTVPAILQSLVQESFREWWGCGLQGAHGQRQHKKSLELLPHLQAPVTPKEMKGWDFTLCVPKNSQVWETSAAVSQFCHLSAWLPSANFTVLSTGCSFSRLAGLGSCAGNITINIPLTAPTTHQVRAHLRLPVFSRIFHLFIETLVQKSS